MSKKGCKSIVPALLDNTRDYSVHTKVKIGMYCVTGKDFTGLLRTKGCKKYFVIDKWEKKQTHNGLYRIGCSQGVLPNVSHTSLVRETEGQPTVKGIIFSKHIRKLDEFKSMGLSRTQPRVLKRDDWYTAYHVWKKWLSREVSDDWKMQQYAHLEEKMRIQETTDLSALPEAPQTHRGQKPSKKWSGWVYQR